MTATESDALCDTLAPPDDGPRGLPGATVRRVAGVNVYTRDGEDWLSTGTVLKIMGLGRIPETANLAAVEYGRRRGELVGDCVRLWIEAGCPEPRAFAEACDASPLIQAQRQEPKWQRFSVVPYLVSFAAWCDYTPVAAEVLIERSALRVFAWADVRMPRQYVELKATTQLTLAHRLQAASYGYCDLPSPCVVRLQKDGSHPEVAAVDLETVSTFDTLARCAHLWVQEQEAYQR